jgi:competence CoiA-like predicted nuclease
MEKARYNDEIIYAHEIANREEVLEHAFRITSKGLLQCCDPDCDSPLLMYCHGKKRTTPYFAHRKMGSSCDAAEFEKNNIDHVDVQYALTDHFRKLGYKCSVEEKKLKHHYTNILVDYENSTLAIDLVRDEISAQLTDSLLNQYAAASINTRWIVISEQLEILAENQTNQIRRHLLKIFSGNLIIITPDGKELKQYRKDKAMGLFCLYSETGEINDLVIEAGEVTIKGFEDRYSAHVDDIEKRKAMISQAEAARKAEAEQAQKREIENCYKDQVDRKCALFSTGIEHCYDDDIEQFVDNKLFDDEILNMMEQIGHMDKLKGLKEDYKDRLFRTRTEKWKESGVKLQRCIFCNLEKPLYSMMTIGRPGLLCRECGNRYDVFEKTGERAESMFWAMDDQGRRIHADEFISKQEYYCPICREPVTLRIGEKNHAHFAHKRGTYCKDSWEYDMSEWHLAWQRRFPENTQEVVVTNRDEKHRADVLVNQTIIEFQHSSITTEDFNTRNIFYNRVGYNVVWVFDLIDEYQEDRISIIDPPNQRYRWSIPKSIFRSNRLPTNVTIYFQFRDSDNDYSLYQVSEAEEDGFTHFITSERYSIKGFVAKYTGKTEVESMGLTLMELWEKAGKGIFANHHVVYVKNIENENVYKITSDIETTANKYNGKCYGYLRLPTASVFENKSLEIPAEDVKNSVWIIDE